MNGGQLMAGVGQCQRIGGWENARGYWGRGYYGGYGGPGGPGGPGWGTAMGYAPGYYNNGY